MGVFIIRDVIHGDIEFDDKIKDILNTSEFQRLHRIHQLSCEYLVFPTATHTRFSHSIGTYHVMKKLIDHFTIKLNEKGYTVKKQDKELAYVAALVHDIGHGAFSHTFEKIFGLTTHERWTIEILKNKNTQIHKVIVKNFGENFLKRLIEVMSKSYKNEPKTQIFNIIATLVSSQTDADRMDYLLRDSYFTSVTNGRYDIERLIKAFGVHEDSDGLKIYIDQKYMSTLEEYVLARYFMHKEVYQHTTKLHMENTLKKIFSRAKKLYMQNEDIFVDQILKRLFEDSKISVQDYLKTDDNYFMFHINKWSDSSDQILNLLSNSFLKRKKYDIELKDEPEKVQKKINDLLIKNNIKPIEDFDEEYFYILNRKNVFLYLNSKENIWVKSKGQERLYDLSEKSLVINNLNTSSSFKAERIFLSSVLFQLVYNIPLNL